MTTRKRRGGAAVSSCVLFLWGRLSFPSDLPGGPLVGPPRFWEHISLSRPAGSLFRPERNGQQHVAIDFAQGVAGQCVEYDEIFRDLIGCKPRRDAVEDFGT